MTDSEQRRSDKLRAAFDPATGPACGVRWRDDWMCRGDVTGLHECKARGEHQWHMCEAQQVSDVTLAAGSVCADGRPASMAPGRPHHHPLPADALRGAA